MIRKFNYTGRKKIPRSCVVIEVIGTNTATRSFKARLNLDGLDLPDDAKVYVEPFCRSSMMRFDYGTVGQLSAPTNRALTDIDFGSRILFRVKVVDENDELPIILASADRITPAENEDDTENRLPILPVETRDLGEEIFRISFDQSGSVLMVNNRIPNVLEVIKSDKTFSGLLYPTVVREVLVRALIAERHFIINNDNDDWRDLWLRFGKNIVGYLPEFQTDDDDDESMMEKYDWVNDVVKAFCSRHATVTGFLRELDSANNEMM